MAVPTSGPVAELYGDFCDVVVFPYEAVMVRGENPVHRVRAARDEVRRLRGLIRRTRAELVIQSAATLPAMLLAARLEGVPAIVYAGELFAGAYASRGARGLAGAALTRFVSRTAAGVIACSEPVARQYRRERGAPVVTILGPVDPAYAGGDRARARREWGVGRRDPCVVSLGSISEGRGQDILLMAMSRVRIDRPETRCLIFGVPHPRPQDQGFRERLEGLVAELGLDGAVDFCGAVTSPADAYAAADVVVNPARFDEPFGRVPFEAALAGRPAVATRVGAVPEYLRDGENALVIPRDDPGAMAAAVGRLLDDPRLRRRLAAAASKFARAEMSPELAIERFGSLLSLVRGTG